MLAFQQRHLRDQRLELVALGLEPELLEEGAALFVVGHREIRVLPPGMDLANKPVEPGGPEAVAKLAKQVQSILEQPERLLVIVMLDGDQAEPAVDPRDVRFTLHTVEQLEAAVVIVGRGLVIILLLADIAEVQIRPAQRLAWVSTGSVSKPKAGICSNKFIGS